MARVRGTCSIDGCRNAHSAHGYCTKHVYRLRENGDPLVVRSNIGKTPSERFWMKVAKTDSCWIWVGCKSTKGYGYLKVNRIGYKAHRLSYEMHHGPIPAGHVVDHMCHNKSCVNPAHLQAVTPKQNCENRSGAQANSGTGVRGVSRNAKSGLWLAQLKHNYKVIRVGLFESIEEAEAAIVAKRAEIFTNSLMDRGNS